MGKYVLGRQLQRGSLQSIAAGLGVHNSLGWIHEQDIEGTDIVQPGGFPLTYPVLSCCNCAVTVLGCSAGVP